MTEAILIDYGFCSGCHSCEVACKNERNIPLGQWGIKVLELGPFVYDDTPGAEKYAWDYVATPTDLCDLCVDRRAKGEKAACENVCQCKSIFVGDLNEITAKAAEIGKKAVIFIP